MTFLFAKFIRFKKQAELGLGEKKRLITFCLTIDTKMMIKSIETLKDLWRNADCVCFDVDSTICTNEAIDELATFCGVGKKVEELWVFLVLFWNFF